MNSRIWSRTKIFLLAIALGITLSGAFTELSSPWIIPIFLGIGYLVGKITCSNHFRQYGIWITLGIVMILNGFHSLLDGVSIIAQDGPRRILAITLHELVRQPALYVVVWGLIEPFSSPQISKVALSVLAITGTWLIGFLLGNILGGTIAASEQFHGYLAAGLFILAGDIIHHLVDEYQGHQHA